jgi:NADH-quinone oxidoreductase subunit L
MGGLGRRMPQVAAPFLIGAAALAGLPFFNGFWSKELLLEAALEHGPLAVYAALALGAGVTAFYAARMCWLVFFAPPAQMVGSETHHGHVSRFMTFPLALLALGVLTAWLLAEPFARWMQRTLPFHADYILPERTVESLISAHTVFSPSTLVVLSLTALGIIAWWWTTRSRRPEPLAWWSRAMAGVDAFFNGAAQAVAGATRGSAALLQRTQTGQLTWNVVGIIVGLVALLVILLGVR